MEQEPNEQVPVNPDQVIGPGEQDANASKQEESTDFISQPAKVKMMKKINDAIGEGYDHVGVTIITLEEDALDNVMIAGHIASSDPKYEEFRKAQAIKPA